MFSKQCIKFPRSQKVVVTESIHRKIKLYYVNNATAETNFLIVRFM